MKKHESNPTAANLVKTLMYFVLGAVSTWICRTLWSRPILQALAMAMFVLFCANLLILVFGLIKPKAHRGQTLVTLLSSLTRYVAALVILYWGLSILGVDVVTIVASVGIVALVVGFGAESLIADVVTGIFMIFENQYNVGDIVEVNGFRGTVKEIGIRTTSIINSGKNVKIVNNSDMRNILNRSDDASVAACSFDIPYETDLEALEAKLPQLLEEIYHSHEDIMLSPPQYLGIQALGASGITLKFMVEVAEDNIYSVPRILNRDLLIGFRKLGIESPYPQLDVHNR